MMLDFVLVSLASLVSFVFLCPLSVFSLSLFASSPQKKDTQPTLSAFEYFGFEH